MQYDQSNNITNLIMYGPNSQNVVSLNETRENAIVEYLDYQYLIVEVLDQSVHPCF